MDFKKHYLSLTVEDREKLAASVKTSVGMLTQVAYGHKKIELGFADVLVAKGGGQFGLNGLPLTDRAESQRKLREVPVTEGAPELIGTEGAPAIAEEKAA